MVIPAIEPTPSESDPAVTFGAHGAYLNNCAVPLRRTVRHLALAVRHGAVAAESFRVGLTAGP